MALKSLDHDNEGIKHLRPEIYNTANKQITLCPMSYLSGWDKKTNSVSGLDPERAEQKERVTKVKNTSTRSHSYSKLCHVSGPGFSAVGIYPVDQDKVLVSRVDVLRVHGLDVGRAIAVPWNIP